MAPVDRDKLRSHLDNAGGGTAPFFGCAVVISGNPLAGRCAHVHVVPVWRGSPLSHQPTQAQEVREPQRAP